ncbi:lipoprotein [Streptomyces sp. NPDC001388]|uniref:lipoprotein n=1 Tax=Streptomyces sp. NPDC001388 TaxID=3364568 RepID=UPI00367F9D53
MRFGVGNGRRGPARAALLTGLVTGLLTGCAAGDGDGSGGGGGGGSTAAEVARRGGTVGAAGSACELPVTFDIAESWKAKAVDAGAADDVSEELADLADAFLHQGPVTMACEIDAKPAGNIGFLRVWTGEPGDAGARAVLEDFVADEQGAGREKYRGFRAGDVTGTEVEYVTPGGGKEVKKARALAVITPDGPVVLHLGGLDNEEHEAMLPAYELAKTTLHTTP